MFHRIVSVPFFGRTTLVTLLATLAAHADGPRLVSQTWENLIGGGVVHSPYDYDAKGLRVQRRDYNSVDSSGPRIARTVWEYDAQDHLIRQVQFGATDTVSILTQSWIGNKQALATVWGKGGVQRYRDTSIYDADGHEIVRKRLSPSDSLVSQHTYTYDNQGQLLADTTWETQGATSAPVQATQTHWVQGSVSWTQDWVQSAGGTRWNALQRTDLVWNGTNLASTTNLSGDGTGHVLIDSTTYTYDASGNESTETTFNADRTASSRITYVWEGISAAHQRQMQSAPDIRWSQTGSSLVLEAAQTPLEISLMDAQGRMVLHTTGTSRSIDIAGLSQGRYLAAATFAQGRVVQAFTTFR